MESNAEKCHVLVNTCATVNARIDNIDMWDKVFKNGPSKICGRQPLKYLKWYGLLKHNVKNS